MELIGLYIVIGLAVGVLLESFNEIAKQDLTITDRVIFVTLWPISLIIFIKAAIS
jgi:hypothetical protein